MRRIRCWGIATRAAFLGKRKGRPWPSFGFCGASCSGAYSVGSGAEPERRATRQGERTMSMKTEAVRMLCI